eukprot:m.72348 g.72348  ORF g.72348 m.72348 type:complete len:487 (+) comp35793_c0_seq1:181-1641(+)
MTNRRDQDRSFGSVNTSSVSFLSDDENERQHPLRSSGRSSTAPKRVLAFVLIAAGFSSIFHAYTLIIGYIVKPVEASCPKWSSSATVIGYALMFATFTVSCYAFLRRIQRGNLRLLTVIQIVLYGVAFSVAGLCTGACNSTSSSVRLVTEVFFILSFIPLAAASFICTAVSIFFLLRWMPEHAGFASAYGGTMQAAGAIILTQIILFQQKLIEKRYITVESLWYITGLITLLPMAVSIPCLISPSRNNEGDSLNEINADRKMSTVDILKTGQFYAVTIARVGVLLPALGLAARQQNFLDVIWLSDSDGKDQYVPIQKLAFFVSFVYLFGNIIWLTSDKITLKGTWILASALQSICFAFLPYLMQLSTSYSKYLAIAAYSIISIAFHAQKNTLPAMCLKVYGRENTGATWGLISISTAVSGISGPLVMEKFYQSSNGQFANFLYFGAGMSVLSLLVTFWIEPVSLQKRLVDGGTNATEFYISDAQKC